jgi:hypothetical protein
MGDRTSGGGAASFLASLAALGLAAPADGALQGDRTIGQSRF